MAAYPMADCIRSKRKLVPRRYINELTTRGLRDISVATRTRFAVTTLETLTSVATRVRQVSPCWSPVSPASERISLLTNRSLPAFRKRMAHL
jgi:hypothetical protein